MSSVKEQKQKLREQVLSRRKNLTEQEWRQKSKKIHKALKNLSLYKDSSVVHVYISMDERNEVSTTGLVDDLLSSKKRVVVPVTDFKSGELIHSEITIETEMQENKWGVTEPKEIDEVDISDLDLIIVPVAAADRQGNRLGYGKGFYDRFLAESSATKAGFVFEEFLFDEIPTEEFDEKLDVIITEEEVIFP